MIYFPLRLTLSCLRTRCEHDVILMVLAVVVVAAELNSRVDDSFLSLLLVR